MIQQHFEELVRENSGLREVTLALIDLFVDSIPRGFTNQTSWFVSQCIEEINAHTHRDHESLPPPTSWTHNLCFLPLLDMSDGVPCKITHRVSDQERDPTAVFKGFIRKAAVGSSLHFQNVIVVTRTEIGTYRINIHNYPCSFFHMIVLDDRELLTLVVRNQIKINGVQLELPREAFLGEFID